ncbi:DUF1552 domain-containing protein [Thermostilla marina]
MKRKHLSRRTVLRGLGTALFLPWLDAMRPALGIESKPPMRLVYFYVPNGIHMPAWRPKEAGPLGTLPPSLEPLTEFKDYLTILSELTLNGARSLGDGPGDHARSAAAFLTGAHPHKTDGADIRNGISVDQQAAQVLGKETRFPSLEVGLDPSAQAGRCDSGYSCAYVSTISWRSPTSPVAKETNPRAIFERLFGDAKTSVGRTDRQAMYRKSVLDFAAEEAASLRAQLGPGDRRKLDEYLYAVRQIERRLERIEAEDAMQAAARKAPPAQPPRAFVERLRLLMDMMILALQTDATRVVTCMVCNAGSNRTYPEVGAKEGHHSLSHHQNDPRKLDLLAKINRHHIEQFGYFLKQAAEVAFDGASLLDSALIMYGSGISDGNRHNHDDLPIILLGKGNGAVRPGRHLVYEKNTPLANLYLKMLHEIGMDIDRFADSTAPLVM